MLILVQWIIIANKIARSERQCDILVVRKILFPSFVFVALVVGCYYRYDCH